MNFTTMDANKAALIIEKRSEDENILCARYTRMQF